MDNSKYLAELTRQQRNAPLSEVRPDLNALLDNVKEFNAKAIANNQDTYESAARKGFTLPTYDEHGNFKGLSFYENEMGKGPS
ncbi:Membrane-associated lipoprotein precursor [Chlamydia abortus]|nr:Membrane-associated lipoprotein precursor [Chlamydia abortus]